MGEKQVFTNSACMGVIGQWYHSLQGKLSKSSARRGRGLRMFYFTVRWRGEGMAARFPAVIDTFSSSEGRKGNLNALTEGEKDNSREV